MGASMYVGICSWKCLLAVVVVVIYLFFLWLYFLLFDDQSEVCYVGRRSGGLAWMCVMCVFA
jgi:hypothetical protein